MKSMQIGTGRNTRNTFCVFRQFSATAFMIHPKNLNKFVYYCFRNVICLCYLLLSAEWKNHFGLCEGIEVIPDGENHFYVFIFHRLCWGKLKNVGEFSKRIPIKIQSDFFRHKFGFNHSKLIKNNSP